MPARWKRLRKPPNTGIHRKIEYSPYIVHKRLLPHTVNEMLTPDNREFMKEYIRDTYEQSGSSPTAAATSPLIDQPWPRGEWDSDTKRTGVLAIKLGSHPLWLKTGKKIFVTLLWVKDNHVISYQPWEQWRPNCEDFEHWLRPRRYTTREFDKVVVGADGQDPRKFTSSYLGLFSDTGLMPKRRIAAFYVSRNAMIQPGTPLNVMHFRVGDYVDCYARTISFGFQGVMKRWGFGGGPSDEFGSTKFHRKPGSLGGNVFNNTVMKGKKLPGLMGGIGRGIRGLKIWRINTKYNILYVNGPVAGPINAWVKVRDTSLVNRRLGGVKRPVDGDLVTAPPMPTFYPGDIADEDIPEEYIDGLLHDFNDPSITFEDDSKKTVIAVRNR